MDPPSRPGAPVLSLAAALWPDFADRFGVDLRPCGGLLLASPAGGAAREALPGEPLSLEAARRMAPYLQVWDGPIHWLPGECAVDAAAALAALEAHLTRRGGRRLAATLKPRPDGSWAHDQGRVRAQWTVLAGGAGSESQMVVAPELAVLTPIRGQILRTAPGRVVPGAAFVRGPGAYVAPQSDGAAMIGATMEAGVRDMSVSPQTSQALLAAAAIFASGLATGPMTARVGVRASTPDALPLVGPSVRSGVLLATGLRRNGWLLAPLVAGMIADYLAGKDPGAMARQLDPQRFGRP